MFSTNRKKSGSIEPEAYFTDEETEEESSDSSTLGRAVVKVPPQHKEGVVERPGLFLITLQKVTEPLKVFGGEPFKAADPLRHFTFNGPIEELTDEVFRSALQKSIASSKSKSAVLFVHGYANSFADAAYRTAQLSYDLHLEKYDAVPLMFSWPSDPSHINYEGAKDRAWSAGQHLAAFLEKIIATTGVGVVHIIAHSMGAEVLGNAFVTLGKSNLIAAGRGDPPVPKFNQIVLAAPDIRAHDFKAKILPAIESGHG